MKKIALSLIVFSCGAARAELPLNPRDVLTVREYVACADHSVTVRLESVSGHKELRVYKGQNYKLFSVDFVDLETKHELKWKVSGATPVHPVGFKSSLSYRPTYNALEELGEDYENFRSHCQMQQLLNDNPFNPKLQDLAVIFGTQKEAAHFYWH